MCKQIELQEDRDFQQEQQEIAALYYFMEQQFMAEVAQCADAFVDSSPVKDKDDDIDLSDVPF